MAKDPTTISMTKGDTATFHFHREDAEGKVITTKPDRIYFTVKAYNSVKDMPVIFQKTIDDFTFDENSEYHFTIEPTDTNGMDYRGEFLYDIEVIADNVKTTIAKGHFDLTYEVTAAGDEH